MREGWSIIESERTDLALERPDVNRIINQVNEWAAERRAMYITANLGKRRLEAGVSQDGNFVCYLRDMKASDSTSAWRKIALKVPSGISPVWLGMVVNFFVVGFIQISWLPAACLWNSKPNDFKIRIISRYRKPDNLPILKANNHGVVKLIKRGC